MWEQICIYNCKCDNNIIIACIFGIIIAYIFHITIANIIMTNVPYDIKQSCSTITLR